MTGELAAHAIEFEYGISGRRLARHLNFGFRSQHVIHRRRRGALVRAVTNGAALTTATSVIADSGRRERSVRSRPLCIDVKTGSSILYVGYNSAIFRSMQARNGKYRQLRETKACCT